MIPGILCPWCAGLGTEYANIKCQYGVVKPLVRDLVTAQKRGKYIKNFCNGKYRSCEKYKQLERVGAVSCLKLS